MTRYAGKSLLMSAGLTLGLAITPTATFSETLTDALIKAYQTSPLLASSQAALRGVDESVPQAKSNLRPQVDAGVNLGTTTGFVDLNQRTDSLSATLDASLLLYDNGQTAAAIESARNGVAAGRADLKDIEQIVLFRAVQAYVDVRRDEEFVRITNNDVERLEETLRATQNRFEVGEVTRTDVSQSQARLAASRSTQANAFGQLQVSREAYRAAVGNLPENLEALPGLPEIPATLSEAEALGAQRNPLIIAAQYRERVAVYDFDRSLAARGVSVAVTGSAGIQRQTNVLGSFRGEPYAAINLRGAMPLYEGGLRSSLVRQAQAVLDQRRFLVQDTARTVRQNIGASWSQINAARVSIVANRQQAEASRIAAEGVAEEARLGARSTLDLLDADQERLEAEAEVVNSIRNEYVAVYGLLQAMGLLTVQHLGLGIETYDPDLNFAQVQNAPRGGYDTSAVDRIRSRWER